MANEIKLITFADSEVTATDDAYVYETATGKGGVINGCTVTIKNASQLHITGGNGILCGRKFTVYDSDINVTLSSSGTLLGRLYIHMDLSNASTPIQLMIETGASLTPVQQDADVNATNGVYEINLATFNVDTSTISDLVDVAPKTGPHTVLNTIEDCVASTNPNDIAGASCISLLNSNTVKFIDVSTLLTTLSTQNASYLATVDCIATGYMANTTGDATLSIDNVEVMRTGVPTGIASGYLNAVYIPIKKGQTITTRATFGTYNIKIYAMQ